MIYILTVHWKVVRWMAPQYKYIKLHTPEKHKLHVHLSPQIEYNDRSLHYDKVYNSNERMHWKKLDLMAQDVCEMADKRDIIVFMDGDAFPIKRYMPTINSFLKKHPLVAIRRDENADECHPHPSFCATTVGFWRTIKGTWEIEPQRTTPDHVRLKDTGGKLWSILYDGNYNWHPLLRSNVRNYHPLFYGVYGHLIYHHGGAFFGRIPRTRLDNSVQKEQRQPWRKAAENYGNQFYHRLGKDRLFFLPLIGKHHCWNPAAPKRCPGA